MASVVQRFDEVNLVLFASRDGRRVVGPRWWIHYCKKVGQLLVDKSGKFPEACACGTAPPEDVVMERR